MLKYWLSLLLSLNALVLAWQFDAFAPWGFGPNQDREPERLGQQIRPDVLKLPSERPVLPPSGAGQAMDAAAAPNALTPSDPTAPDALSPGATPAEGALIAPPAAPAGPSSR